MDDTKFLIIVDKNDYEVIDWSILDKVSELLSSAGYQLKCRTDFEGMCSYCDGVRKILEDSLGKIYDGSKNYTRTPLRELGE